MFNKKILLSLLTVGLLACVASAATWAYFQDNLDVNNTRITTANLSSQYALAENPIDGDWVAFNGDTGNRIASTNITNINPGDGNTLQYIKIRNMGNTSASVIATITPTSSEVVNDLVISVGGTPIYTLGAFTPGGTSFPVDLGPVASNGANTVDASISYVFTDSMANQNNMQNKSIAFDTSIAVKATT